MVVHHPIVRERKIQKVIEVLIRDIVVEVQKAHHGQGADLTGVDLTLDHTHDLEVQLVHTQGLGRLHLDLVPRINIAIIHRAADHLHIILLVVMMEDESKENLDPVGGGTL